VTTRSFEPQDGQRLATVTSLHARRRMFAARLALPPLEKIGTTDYYLLGAVTIFLAAFGLVMVLSASSVELSGSGSNPYGDFAKQAIAGFVGLALMILASRRAPRFWVTVAPYVFAASIALQLLTTLTPLGNRVNGNQNWITILGFSVQPSEFVKFGLILVLASFFARKRAERLTIVGLVPVAVLAGIAIVSVLAGKDLGTSLIIGLIVLGGMYFAGVRIRVLVTSTLLVSVIFFVAAIARGSRLERLTAWTQGCGTDTLGTCWQSLQGTWALAAGGVFGVGIGNSVSKWFWLPEADSDFILAVIGEETGLVGLTLLLLLFLALTIVFLRITSSTGDAFTRAATGMTLAWIVGQAFANIAVVLGFAPVFGVPLPFISSGGSSMVANLVAVGFVMSLTRERATAAVDRPSSRPFAALDVAEDDARSAAMRAHPAFHEPVPVGPPAVGPTPRSRIDPARPQR
jgi:cell division protein FtsW